MLKHCDLCCCSAKGDFGKEEEEEPYLRKITVSTLHSFDTLHSYVCIVYALLLISFCTPVPHLPLLFQGVSASGLPTKSLSLTPIKTHLRAFPHYI
jgi:hypothetical protein